MTAILKVDTIQDTSGNNIINESSDTITIGASGDTITIPAGATISNSGTATGFGKIGQVVQVVKSDTFSNNATSFTDITGLSVAITPVATSSKVLVFVALKVGGANSQTARLLRDATVIDAGDTASNRPLGFANFVDVSTYAVEIGSAVFLDSPSTTSATTYKIQMISSGGTYYVNRSNSDRDTAQYDPRLASSITLVEVLA